jgi:uncharacterized protein
LVEKRKLSSFQLDFGQTHLKITADISCKEAALNELMSNYNLLVAYINKNPLFKTSYDPLNVNEDSPRIVKLMSESSKICNVGPMAAVAGAFSELIGQRIVTEGAYDVLVENGGDIYLNLKHSILVGIHSGPSPLSDKIGFKVKPKDTPCGICTSSATVGPSINLGKADSITVVAETAVLADAAATAVGNVVHNPKDIELGLSKGKEFAGVRGVVIIIGENIGVCGNIPELVET